MSRNRTNFGLAAVAAVLVLFMGASCFAQGLAEMEWFETTDDSRYGGGNRPAEGFFFAFDGLFWHIGAPDATTIGKENTTRFPVFYHTSDPPGTQNNTHDTTELQNGLTPGNRYEFGHISGHHGWFFNWFDLRTQTQRLSYSSGIDIVIDDAGSGPTGQGFFDGLVWDVLTWTEGSATYANPAILPLPVTFDDIQIKNTVEMWGTELMYKYRMHPGHHGGIFEFFAGARYLEFDDDFDVFATGDRFYVLSGTSDTAVPFGPRTILADSTWNTQANNHIVGPQIGLRWFRRAGRFTMSTEGRFFAGVNFQAIHQEGILGSKLDDPLQGTEGSVSFTGLNDPPFMPNIMDPSPFYHTQHNTEWAPAGELRVQGKYQLTEAITFRVGWTGLAVHGIARASNKIDYQISTAKTMGIRDDNSRQTLFVQGINFGLDLNY